MSETYYEMLERLSAEKNADRVNNSSAVHAADFLYVLIANAEKNINIVSKNLHIYTDEWVCKAFKRILDNGITVKILLDGKKEDIDKDNEFLEIAKNSQNCQIKITDEKLSAHIVTRDGIAYRYCADTQQHTAFGSFNAPTTVKNADEQLFEASYGKQQDF